MADHLATATLSMAITWGLFLYGAIMLWAGYRAAQAVGKAVASFIRSEKTDA